MVQTISFIELPKTQNDVYVKDKNATCYGPNISYKNST